MSSDALRAAPESAFRLGDVQPGFRGVITAVRRPSGSAPGATDPEELELRLLEFGFVEGAQVEVLQEGPIGGDPIAVRVDDMRVALRRSEAMNVILAAAST
ncbi:ferrous iron transport protein A [Phenylobacterium sp.]|jgi:ferrous iron transport protein A|uniref:ferrous iron transport protein A n=1 Tax=Phenylobacterium sp. TaxID=1871053 RepID=UPI0037C8AF20